MVLEIEDVGKQFDGLTAVDEVCLKLEDQIVGLIGPNGSGKSTLIDCISRVHDLSNGTIKIEGVEITDKPIHEIANLGIARTFQVPRIFENLTVLNNTLVPLLRTDICKERANDIALSKLELVDLFTVRDKIAKNISGGQKKLLEFARSLVHDPQIVLMDEPFAGVNPSIKTKLQDEILNLRSNGIDFIIVSHSINDVFKISDRVDVMCQGKIITSLHDANQLPNGTNIQNILDTYYVNRK